jgi:hypothetical protein
MTHLDAARAAMVPGGQLIILNKEWKH